MEDPDLVARILTRFMGDVMNAFGSLTVGENMRAQWHEFRVIVPDLSDGLILAGYRLSVGSLTTATETIVNFGLKEWDTHNAVVTGASWKFVAPFTGKFIVSTAVTLTATPMDTTVQLNLYKNGIKYRRLWRSDHGDVTNDLTMNGTVVVDMVQNDYIDIRAYQNSGSTLSYDPDDETWIQISEIDTELKDSEPIPAGCWPYEFTYEYDKRPRAVLATEIRELSNNAYIGAMYVDWDFTVREGKPVVRIRNIPGLTPGRAYKITLLVIVE